eukprot:9115518-Pyramimonas_sp.AAC.1
MAKLIATRLKNVGVCFTSATDARDLGVGRAAKGATRRATHAAGMAMARARMNVLGNETTQVEKREEISHVEPRGCACALAWSEGARR